MQTAPDRHASTRVQHEVVRRQLTVVDARPVAPRTRRVAFDGPSLRTFNSLAFDDHVKVFFPTVSPGGEPATAGRDFTPRRFDLASAQLTIDFALHESGPASAWARQARVGDALQIGGPKSSVVVADEFDGYLMVGDETALPAIGRRLEDLRPGVPVRTVVVVPDDAERQTIATAANWTAIWVTRDPAAADGDAAAVRQALAAVRLTGGGHAWLAGESAMVRDVRSYLIDDRGIPALRLRAAGYWKRGLPGAHERM